MRILFIIFLLSVECFFSSCNNNDKADAEINKAATGKEAPLMEAEEYVQWVEDEENGLKKQKKIDDLIFTVQYKPYEYIACMENQETQLTDSVLKNTIAELSDMQYYDFKIELKDRQGELLKHRLSSPLQYDQRVKYFSFGMQKDIQLVQGADTIPCGLYHFERAYDVAPFSKVLLGFPLKNAGTVKEKTLIIYDRIFNTGLLKFTFSNKELTNIPKLKVYEN